MEQRIYLLLEEQQITLLTGHPSTLTGTTLTGLSAGNYTVTVTDANGCTDSASVTIGSANALITTVRKENVSCNGQSNGLIEVVGVGGDWAYTYNWNPAAANSGLNDNLTAGSYSVTISDQNNCSVVFSTTITEPALLAVNLNLDKTTM